MTLKNRNKTAKLLRRIISDERFSFIRRLQKTHPASEIFLVGGSVRDALCERVIKDFDFVVRGVPMKKIEVTLKPLGTVNAVGRVFGVLKFCPNIVRKNKVSNEHVIDIALPRTEHSGSLTGHYRDFVVKSDWRLPIEDDLSRRDFTINAIAFDCIRGEFVDPFGGMDDLSGKIIRCVGNPADRFAEDYSRMLRAIRFSCQLGFDMDQNTSRGILQLFPHINKKIKSSQLLVRTADTNTLRAVPYETIAKELSVALLSDASRAVELFDMYGAFKELMPQVLAMKKCPQPPLWHSEGDVWTHTKLCLKVMQSKKFKNEFGASTIEPILYWAVLLHDIGKPPALKTPKKDGVDRIRFDGHDRMGAVIAKEIAERLRLASVKDMHIDPDDLWWLINYHLLVLNTDLSQMKHTTIEKYFFRDARKGLLLRQLIFADSLGSKRADGKTSLGSYRALKRRLKEYEVRFKQKNRLPPAILDGDEIMRAAGISSGPLVGKLILLLREEQLAKRITTKKSALHFLKKQRVKKEK